MRRGRKASPEYARSHYAARKAIAKECERCGASPVDAALRPDVPTERLHFDAGINCYYSLDRTDYFALCRLCHRRLDGVELRTHCKDNHEYTKENTTLRPSGARRCKICTREQVKRNEATPARREAKRIYNLERRPARSDEAKLRHVQQQRERRAAESDEVRDRRNQQRRAARATRIEAAA